VARDGLRAAGALTRVRVGVQGACTACRVSCVRLLCRTPDVPSVAVAPAHTRTLATARDAAPAGRAARVAAAEPPRVDDDAPGRGGCHAAVRPAPATWDDRLHRHHRHPARPRALGRRRAGRRRRGRVPAGALPGPGVCGCRGARVCGRVAHGWWAAGRDARDAQRAVRLLPAPASGALTARARTPPATTPRVTSLRSPPRRRSATRARGSRLVRGRARASATSLR
jgi:hypothetical protein